MSATAPLLLAAVFDLHPAVKITLIALAAPPVPPLLPKKELKAGGSAAYTVGVLVATALLAVGVMPILFAA